MKLSELVHHIGDVDIEVEPNDVITDALIICRVQRPEWGNGESALVIGASDGVDVVLQVGLIKLAEHEILSNTD